MTRLPMVRRWLALLLACSGLAAQAQPLTPLRAPAGVAVTQRLGAQLPLQLRLQDSENRAVRLGDGFQGQRPALLVLGYYTCPQLCGLVMHGLLEALHESGLAPSDYAIVRVSIDPQDSAAAAQTRRDADLGYAAFLQADRPAAPLPDLRVLTGSAAAIAQLAQATGVAFRSSDAAPGERPGEGAQAPARFDHPAAVMVVTPHGEVAQYLMGVRFDGSELRSALVDASARRISTWTDRLALLCAHFNPTFGLHTPAVLWTLRAGGLGLVLLLAALWWRQRRAPPPPGERQA